MNNPTPSPWPTIENAGVDALIIYFGDQASPSLSQTIHQAQGRLRNELSSLIVDSVASYTSLWLQYRPHEIGYHAMVGKVLGVLSCLANSPNAEAEANGNERLYCPAAGTLTQVIKKNPTTHQAISLPVYYGPECALDLKALADYNRMTPEDVIDQHLSMAYQVYTIGFAPGFGYLGEVPSSIAKPRLDTPRASVPKGSVGIADRQTAIYPAASPGGWNIIGRCPLNMFDPQQSPAMPFNTGDRVRFYRINRSEFLALGGVFDEAATP